MKNSLLSPLISFLHQKPKQDGIIGLFGTGLGIFAGLAGGILGEAGSSTLTFFPFPFFFKGSPPPPKKKK
jgi:hypothetical protein